MLVDLFNPHTNQFFAPKKMSNLPVGFVAVAGIPDSSLLFMPGYFHVVSVLSSARHAFDFAHKSS
jgi:hypothetical protein